MGLALKDTERYCYSDNLHWLGSNYELIDDAQIEWGDLLTRLPLRMHGCKSAEI
ncbi:MAG: hypothetical protein GQ548_06475 [Methylophaga sp.]|nr:hypothetical protein [Methylophaga sp.]